MFKVDEVGGDGGGVDGVGGGEGEGKAPAHGNHRLGKSQVKWFMLMVTVLQLVMVWLEVRYQLVHVPNGVTRPMLPTGDGDDVNIFKAAVRKC